MTLSAAALQYIIENLPKSEINTTHVVKLILDHNRPLHLR